MTARDQSDVADARIWMRGVVVAVTVGLMALGPLLAFSGSRPSPWGWQMYAGQVDMPKILVTKLNGEKETRDSYEILAWPRPEPDYFEPMAKFVCAKDPSARSVRLTRVHPAADKDFECASF